ncbi:hypothetical protein PR003_g23423 [Phytophthora rubi]|uniref:Uncharacterized protein n=1 Tax=Phytophthora rubi TaxID=129364 RepID=A0A6A4CVL8_9STRA|nr:hypothetical protein PR002_g25012 [Phytophthora rubi]KAE9297725.1 hypothetical protein PR003_g23423 [Phytophthora rubi]
MRACVKAEDSGVSLFRHCGYGQLGLNDAVFEEDREAV